jgi:hypothetical protein
MISGKPRKEQQCCRQRYEPLLQMIHTMVKKAVVRRQRLASFLLQIFFRESLRFLSVLHLREDSPPVDGSCGLPIVENRRDARATA